MSDDPFFNLSGPVKNFDAQMLAEALDISKHVCNVSYRPDIFNINKNRVEGVTFENVSFSKTEIKDITFKDCKFLDCLFIATKFVDINVHSCSFRGCNFYKASFKGMYGKPGQFSSAILSDRYANIAVHLYQELRDNYVDKVQPEFMREAEYQFNKWSHKLSWVEMRRARNFRTAGVLGWLGFGAYGVFFGFGLRLRNLAITTLSSVLFLTILAKTFAEGFFKEEGIVTWIRSMYFTVSTMITLGAVGFTPKGDAGYIFLMLNAFVGVVLLSATLNAFSKRVSR
ncbi:ion channel [Xanthomonas arboricola]|uniref:ion channel n=1 Tax=Xanthomonas arboricola TaxID=56448 RepID=UPI000E1F3283|nr:pentapeptide repeat-containing protein [Xanthomonas arboricola]